jgi:hypothetical protein
MERVGRTPTVVFETAVGDWLETWSSIFDQVAALAPVVAYDRAFLGGSPEMGVCRRRRKSLVGCTPC